RPGELGAGEIDDPDLVAIGIGDDCGRAVTRHEEVAAADRRGLVGHGLAEGGRAAGAGGRGGGGGGGGRTPGAVVVAGPPVADGSAADDEQRERRDERCPHGPLPPVARQPSNARTELENAQVPNGGWPPALTTVARSARCGQRTIRHLVA